MRVIKKRGLSSLPVFLLAGFLWNCGCTPPGPRALLKGEKLIQAGQYEKAIEQLQTAVRLLPKNPQAWNYLGLAYHGHREAGQAARAYRQALALDHKLAAARFNLGSLLLEVNDLPGAIEQLTSYTLIEPRSVDGLLKLATAHLRARHPDPAEKLLKTVLNLQPKNPEALNGLGLVQIQRRRTAEGINYFNLALAQNSHYGPALLNAAIAYQAINNRQAALQRYRQYILLQPRQADRATVLTLVRELEAELNPVPNPPPRTNPPPVLAQARTNLPGKTTGPRGGTSLANSNVLAHAPKTSAPPVRVTPPNTSTDLEVTRVGEDMVVRPPQDISLGPPPAIAPSNMAERVTPPGIGSVPPGTPKNEKRGFFSRINPFGNHTKPGPPPVVVAMNSNTVGTVSLGTNTPTSLGTPAPPPVPAFPRYAYVSPPRPGAGKRSEAEPYFTAGVKAQQAGQLAQALGYYQRAIQLDPAYFEAYYNQGLAAYDQRAWKTALLAFECALAIKADSIEARYNFALALKQAGFYLDAAAELERILRAQPTEARAHFSLAILYAQKLNQPALAYEHYSKVLEYDPRHPKAAEIRYWLGAHPLPADQ